MTIFAVMVLVAMSDYVTAYNISVPEASAHQDSFIYEVSPMSCQEMCEVNENCGSWSILNHRCTMSPRKAVPPLYFTRESNRITGGKITTEDMKEEALLAFQNSFNLLSESIPDDNSCQFLELKENLSEITKFTNESIENIEMVDSFLSLNDELLGDLFLIQSEKERHTKTKIQEKKQEINHLNREVSNKNEIILTIEEKLNGIEKKKVVLIQNITIVKQNEETERKHVLEAQNLLNEKKTRLNSKATLKNRAKGYMNSAKAERDRQESIYQSALSSFNYHRREHKKKMERMKWAWIVPGYNIYHAIDTIEQYETEYKNSRSSRNYWGREYGLASERYSYANDEHQKALQSFYTAEKQEREVRTRLDYYLREMARLKEEQRSFIFQIKNFQNSVRKLSNAVEETKLTIFTTQDRIKLSIRNELELVEKVRHLMEAKRKIKNEMEQTGRIKKSVVSVQVLLQSVGAKLRYSNRKTGGNLFPTWTIDDFEDAVEEVFIGIKDALSTLISEASILSEMGDRVSYGANRMKTAIKQCETGFGSSFQLEDM